MSESSQDAIDKINQLASQSSTAPPPGSVPTGLSEGAAAMASGSQTMLAQARSGGFTLDPDTGQALINTLNKQIETLHGLGEDVVRISRETRLGMTPGGQAMAKFNHEVAVSGAKAFVPAHDQFVQTLITVVQAVQIAMDNYARTEHDNASKLKAKD